MLLLRDVIKKIFNAYGYDVMSGGEKEDWILLATKEKISIAIGYNNNDVKKSDLVRFLSNSSEINADKHIYISTALFEEDAKKFAEEMNIILWEIEKLEEQIGKTTLMDCGIKYKNEDFDAFFQSSKRKEINNEVGFSEDEKPLKANIKKKDAEKIAEKIMHKHLILELFPYYIFEYKCEILIEGKIDMKKLEGMIGVNAITKDVIEWEETEEGSNYEVAPIKHRTKFDMKKAMLISRAYIVKSNTKEITMKVEKQGNVLYEKKRIEPNTETIEMINKGIYYLPIWHVEGTNGIMKINAVNGEVVKEEIRS